MAELITVYWRDIPAQVIAKVGRATAREKLSERFATAIDQAAMRARLHATDDYLEQWRRGAPVSCGDDLEASARRAAEALEASYSDARLAALVRAGGVESKAEMEQE